MLIAETKHLILREFTTKDAPFILKLLNTPQWLKYIGDRNVKTQRQAIMYLKKGSILSYSSNGFGLYLVHLKNRNTPIGMCGLIKRNFLKNVDIGFAFLPEFAGKGLGYESASAVLEYAKEKLALKKVVAITSTENVASIKLLQKLNLKFEKMILFPNEEKESMLLSIILV